MEKTDNYFSCLELPAMPLKPRTTALTCVEDRGMSTGEAINLMESFGELIDYMNICDHSGFTARYSAEWFRRKLAIYHGHQVKMQLGGLTFELAVLQDKVRPLMEGLKALGFDCLEIVTQVIEPLPPKVRSSYIKMAQEIGLEPHTEVGKKHPTIPLDAGEAIMLIQSDLEAGATKVVLESAEIALLMKTDITPLHKIVEAIGLDVLIFETGPYGWPEVAIHVIKSFGKEVNLANIDPPQVVVIDNMRRGMDRRVEHEFLTVKRGRVAT
jgi:phosphosulfolactate synthase